MTILSELLEAIAQEIDTNFSQHRQIHVTPLAGTPPEQYRITYHLQGLCKEDGGGVRPCAEHIITITLPFGFPHFPPNCRPESPVFHPDFDQAAICIGEFWEKSQSLSELILYIGRMLCGEVYSSNNAFNEEAATWYKENQNQLPLDTLDQLSSAAETLSSPGEQTVPSAALLTMESIDDALFADNEMREADVVEAYEQTEESLADIAAEKTVRRSAATPPYPNSDPELDSASQRRLNEARKKHQEGEAFELHGQPVKALERYQAVKNLVPDFPEIDKDISRAQYSQEMLGDWADGDSPMGKSDGDRKNSAKKLKEKQATPTKKKNASSHQEKKRQISRRSAIAIGSVCMGFLLILTCSYLFLNSQLGQAQTMVQECRQLLDRQQFPAAEQKCSGALELSARILFIKQGEKRLLTEEIRQLEISIRSNKEVAIDATGLPEWQQSMKFADTFLADSQWQEALAGYSHTLELASKEPAIDPLILDQILTNKTMAELNMAIQAGEQALTREEWDSAKTHMDMAMALARKNPQTPSSVIARIESLSSQVEFNTFMAAGDRYFSQGEWANALAAFTKAQEIEGKFAFADAQTRGSLQEIIVRTKVFESLEQGKKAFTEAQWDQAITHYEAAIQLLEENSEILRRDNPLESQQKISRLMLHAAIIRDKQSVANHLKSNEFSQAIDKMRAIIETIGMSSFAGEEEFQTIISETQLSINQGREDLLMAKQVAYLTANYKKLFTQNNPALIAARLSHPRVIFLKKIGNKNLYRVQCSEEGQGRPVLLQANYIYDPATQKWHLQQG